MQSVGWASCSVKISEPAVVHLHPCRHTEACWSYSTHFTCSYCYSPAIALRRVAAGSRDSVLEGCQVESRHFGDLRVTPSIGAYGADLSSLLKYIDQTYHVLASRYNVSLTLLGNNRKVFPPDAHE